MQDTMSFSGSLQRRINDWCLGLFLDLRISLYTRRTASLCIHVGSVLPVYGRYCFFLYKSDTEVLLPLQGADRFSLYTGGIKIVLL